MKILFAGTGFKFAANTLSKKINEINYKLDDKNRLELVFQDYSKKLEDQLEDIVVLIPTMEKINEKIILKGSKSGLRLIQQFGVGLEGVDINTATRCKIYVANAQGTNGITVAETTIFLMLALAKKLKSLNKSFKERQLGFPVADELYNKTLGIIGLGNSGIELVKRAKAFGMKIIAIKKTPNPQLIKSLGIDFLGTSKDLNYLLQNSDFISLHLPATDETINMINVDQFKMMKKKPFLINVARGPIINKDALIMALENNLIKGAALDVFWNEPPDPNDKLFLNFDNVITTPHIGGTSNESVNRIANIVIHNISSIFNNKINELKCVVNKF
ncbi:MAG: 2-hydroxyacid dehydrogenase [Candidatus Helarchaeota archaeon]